MEVACSFEVQVNIYHITKQHVPGDTNIKLRQNFEKGEE
jgi:hypothetical protein